MREIRGSYNIEPYCHYCFVLLIFEIDLVGIWLSPLLWYSLHISRSDIVLIFSIYICLKRFGLTFLEEKYPFRDHPISTYAKFSEKLTFLTPPPPPPDPFNYQVLFNNCFKITLSPSAAQIGFNTIFHNIFSIVVVI